MIGDGAWLDRWGWRALRGRVGTGAEDKPRWLRIAMVVGDGSRLESIGQDGGMDFRYLGNSGMQISELAIKPAGAGQAAFLIAG